MRGSRALANNPLGRLTSAKESEVTFLGDDFPGLAIPISWLRARFANKHDRWSPLVRRELQFPIATFYCDTNGGKILRVDDAGSPCRSEVLIAPGDDNANSFGCIAPAVCI